MDGIEKVFLPKRASTKKFLPNVYELPGGHIDFGEGISLFSGLGKKIKLKRLETETSAFASETHMRFSVLK